MSNKNKSKLIKRLITGAMCLTLVFSINGFASVVSDNDGSAFITKAEFDSLKNNFQSQIDQYNQSIDSKIDGAIAAYLAGLTLTTRMQRALDSNRKIKFPLYSCRADEELSIVSKMRADVRYDVMLPTLSYDEARVDFRHNKTNTGFLFQKDWEYNQSPVGGDTGNVFVFQWAYFNMLAAGKEGKYWAVKWDATQNGWFATNYYKGTNKFENEVRVRDLEILDTYTTGNSTLRGSGQLANQAPGASIETTPTYYYAIAVGLNAGSMNQCNDDTPGINIQDNVVYSAPMFNWNSVALQDATSQQRDCIENGFEENNQKITDFIEKLKTAWTPAASGCTQTTTFPGTSVYTEDVIYSNKIYSKDARINVSNRTSDHWIYKPTKVDGHWQSSDWKLIRTYKNKGVLTNWSKNYSNQGLISYNPKYEYWIPEVEPTTNDTNYGENAIFTAISAKKLHWVDENDEVHTFDEGLYLGKNKKAGSLEVRLKFAEPNNRNVKCAFSKVPFTSSWAESNALTVKRSAGAGTESVKIGTYTCGTEYVITVADLEEGDKLYMNFWGDQEEYCPSIETFEMYDIMSS